MEPRSLNSDLIVMRVRAAMDSVARLHCPNRNVVVPEPELDWRPEEASLAVCGWPVSPAARAFLSSLLRWQETDSTSTRAAVVNSAGNLMKAWVAALQTAIQVEKLDQEFGDPSSHREATIVAVRELVLQGLVIDTGRRREGQIVWAVGDYHSRFSMWDA